MQSQALSIQRCMHWLHCPRIAANMTAFDHSLQLSRPDLKTLDCSLSKAKGQQVVHTVPRGGIAGLLPAFTNLQARLVARFACAWLESSAQLAVLVSFALAANMQLDVCSS